MKPVQRPKLTSPLERERGPSRSKSQAVPRPAAERGAPAGGHSPCQGVWVLSPAPAEPPKSFALGRSLQSGQLWEDSPGGTAGVSPRPGAGGVLLRDGSGSAWSPGPKGERVVWHLPPGTWDQGSFGVIRDLPRCEGWGHLWVRGTWWARTARLPSQVGKPGAWRGGRSPSSLVPALHRHLGAELCWSGPEQGWHQERTNPPVPGTAEPGTPPGLAASAAEQGLARCRMGARELPAPPRLCSPGSAGAEPGKMLSWAGSQEGASEDFSFLSSAGWAQPAPCP